MECTEVVVTGDGGLGSLGHRHGGDAQHVVIGYRAVAL